MFLSPSSRPDRAGWPAPLLVALACCAGVALLLLPLWRRPELVLAFNDGNLELVRSPLFSYPQSLWRIWNDHVYFGRGEAGIGPTGWGLLETLLGPVGYRRWGPLFGVVFTGLAGFWCTRQMRSSVPAAVCAGLLAAFSGWALTSPLSGLLGRTLTFAWSLCAFGLVARAERRPTTRQRLADMALAGGALGLAITDTPDVGAFFALALAGWWLVALRPPRATVDRWTTHLPAFLLLVVSSALVSHQTLVKMIHTEVAPALASEWTETEAWDWATQWSLPIAESLSLVIPDAHGASSRSAERPYWGEVGRTPGWRPGAPGWRHLKLNSYAVGSVVGLLLLLLAAETDRAERPACAPQLEASKTSRPNGLCLALAWGRFFIAYGLVASLPLLDTIRNPEKWLGPATLFAILATAVAVDLVGAWVRRSPRIWLRPTLAMCFLCVLAAIVLSSGLRPDAIDLAAEQHRAAWRGTERAIGSTAATFGALALGALGLARLPARRRAGAAAALLTIVGSAQLLDAARPYVETTEPRRLDDPSPLVQALDNLQPAGRLKLLPARDPLLNTWRLTDLASRAAPLFDPVSVRALPEGERRMFEAFAARPLDLWRLGGVRWFLATPPAAAELTALAPEATLVETRATDAWDPRLAAREEAATAAFRRPIHLLELPTAQPLIRRLDTWEVVDDSAAGDAEVLARFADPAFAAVDAAFIHRPVGVELPSPTAPAAASKASKLEVIDATPTRLEVIAHGPGMLLRASRHDPRWRVTIDGETTPLLRANTLFQAAALKAGRQQVVFEFAPSQTLLGTAILARVALVLLFVGVWRHDRRQHIDKDPLAPSVDLA